MARRQTSGESTRPSSVHFRVMKFSADRHEIVLLQFGEWTTGTAANLLDDHGHRVTAIRQPNARFALPWDEDVFRAVTRTFVQEFNVRQLTSGGRAVSEIEWLARSGPTTTEPVT